MRRRQRLEDSDHRDRWLVSYADFITLLFGFFVVMYSVSSVNDGKYKVLSAALSGVFSAPPRSLHPIEVGVPALPSVPAQAVDNPPVILPQTGTAAVTPEEVVVVEPEPEPEPVDTRFGEMAARFEQAFADLMASGLVTVSTSDNWIEVTLPNSILFGSGEAEPHRDAFTVVNSVADILKGTSNAVIVEGFTDNRPIRTTRYPSNWELSAARAATMVRLLVETGIDPQRLAAVGYGEHQALARNDTPEGRRRNRRVVLLVSRHEGVRPVMRQ